MTSHNDTHNPIYNHSPLYDILTPTILDTLAPYLTIRDIISLSRTNRSLSGFYEAMIPRKWNVDRLLRRFVDNPRLFRMQVGVADGLLAGDFVWEFFAGMAGGGGSASRAEVLDVVVPAGGAEVIAEWLLGREGYVVDELVDDKIVDGSDDDDNDNAVPIVGGDARVVHVPYRHIDKMYQFTRTRTAKPSRAHGQNTYHHGHSPEPISTTTTTTIRIFITSDHSFPLRGILEGSWSTASVCLMSYRMAYCVFPALSFLRRRSFMLGQPGVHLTPRILEFQHRGFVFETGVSAYAVDDEKDEEGGLGYGVEDVLKGKFKARRSLRREVGHSMQKCRKIGDRFTWKIGFEECDFTDTFDAEFARACSEIGATLPPRLVKAPVDPVKPEDILYISENMAELNENMLQHLELLGLSGTMSASTAKFAHHYDAKYMRWNKIYC